MPFQTINPYTGEFLFHIPFDNSQAIKRKIDAAESCFLDWKRLSFSERAVFFIRLASLLDRDKGKLAALITLEMGKPIRESVAEIEKSALTARYYAENAEGMMQPVPMMAGQKAEVHFRPLGVVFGIFPWNYPLWQVLRFVIPTLMAGNTAVFKHAENTPQCAAALIDLFNEAGFPDGALSHLYASLDQIEGIIAHPAVHAVTLTGSSRAGSSVAALAGEYLKKVVLELGGSDPFIVLPDANLQEAAKIGVQARYQNTGQSCIAAKRFVIHESVYDTFLAYFLEELDLYNAGDPMLETTRLGVLAREDLSLQLESQIKDTLASGAIRVHGGQRVGTNGFIPGILTHIPKASRAYQEELFGPVAGFYTAATMEEAVHIANATPFGLGASVWTADEEEFRKLAAEIESGMVYWNSMVKSTPELPFGGVKNSGIGRELSIFGIHEFTNIQLLYPL
ncbi:MAG: NAD-dependent succinate-semialdehyde dehydrogenase [Bacteroidia bacterium]